MTAEACVKEALEQLSAAAVERTIVGEKKNPEDKAGCCFYFTQGCESENEVKAVSRTLERVLGDAWCVVGGEGQGGIVSALADTKDGVSVLLLSATRCSTFAVEDDNLPNLDWETYMREPPSGMVLLCAGDFEIQTFSKKMDLALPDTCKIGGSINPFLNGKSTQCAGVVFKNIETSSVLVQGSKPVSKTMTVTDTEGSFITELDGGSVADAVASALGPESRCLYVAIAQTDDYVVHHAFVMSDRGFFVPSVEDIRPGALLRFQSFDPQFANDQLLDALTAFRDPSSYTAVLAASSLAPPDFSDVPKTEYTLFTDLFDHRPAFAGFYADNGVIGPSSSSGSTYLHSCSASAALFRRHPTRDDLLL